MAISTEEILFGNDGQLTPRARQLLRLIVDAVKDGEPIYGLRPGLSHSEWRDETAGRIYERLPEVIYQLQEKAKRLDRPRELTLFDILHSFERQYPNFVRPQDMFFPERL